MYIVAGLQGRCPGLYSAVEGGLKMSDTRKTVLTALIASTAAAAMLTWLILPSQGASAAEPTCSGTLGIAVHGQHIVGDYVTGIGHGDLGWPPSGRVGQAVKQNGGVAIAGGPGPGFHFPNGFAPGASFCLDQSKSPGTHPGP
jgi:hypothetical protein